MPAAAAIYAHRPAPARRIRPAPPRHRRTPPHTPRHAGRVSAEPLESRMLLAAETGVFDPTFGNGGKARFDVNGLADEVTWVHALAGGAALVAGKTTYNVTITSGTQPTVSPYSGYFLARLNADGALDPAFGQSGVVDLSPLDVTADAVAVQPDGKILVGGMGRADRTVPVPTPPPGQPADPAFTLARFQPDGMLDAGFGDGGVATLNFKSEGFRQVERITALAFQPDGGIAAAGEVERPAGEHALPATRMVGLARFKPDGTVDDAFARSVQDVNVAVRGVIVEPDGKVVVGASPGRYYGADDPTRSSSGGFSLFRFNPDGTTDNSFGQGGLARVAVAAGGDFFTIKLNDLLLQPDGKLALVSSLESRYFAMARVTPDGAPDATFGGGDGLIMGEGVAALTFGAVTGQYRLAYDASDGSYRVGGVGTGIQYISSTTAGAAPTRRATGLQAFSARFAADGTPLSAGRAIDLPMTGAEQVVSATIDDAGKIVAAGTAFPTQDAGEGFAYTQSADALLVRFDPAALPPVPDLLSLTLGPPTGTSGGPRTDPDPVSYRGNGGGLGGVNDSSNGSTIVLNSAAAITNVGFAGRTVVRGGRTYSFRVSYPTETLARQTPVTVTGPNGFAGSAAVLKVKVAKAPRRIAVGTAVSASPALASYRAPAPGGKFDAADNGTYAVRLNATAGAAASGQIVGLVTVNARPAGGARPVQSAFRKVELPSTGVLRGTASVAGNVTGWVLDRADAGAAGEVVDLDLGRFPGEAAALSGRLVTVAGSFKQETRAGRGVVSVFVVESIAAAM